MFTVIRHFAYFCFVYCAASRVRMAARVRPEAEVAAARVTSAEARVKAAAQTGPEVDAEQGIIATATAARTARRASMVEVPIRVHAHTVRLHLLFVSLYLRLKDGGTSATDKMALLRQYFVKMFIVCV